MTPINARLSILDLAPLGRGETAGDSFAASVALAQRAEELGYERVWYAEHHNIPTIASSATSVLIAHVGAHTQHDPARRRRHHAAQPRAADDRRAVRDARGDVPGPDRPRPGPSARLGSEHHARAAPRRRLGATPSRRTCSSCRATWQGTTVIPGVDAIPGEGSNVPLYILGSSLFGAQLAAALGLPYAFASHFAPAALQPALAAYRDEFQPSEQLDRPYVIAGVNVLAADTTRGRRGAAEERPPRPRGEPVRPAVRRRRPGRERRAGRRDPGRAALRRTSTRC